MRSTDHIRTRVRRSHQFVLEFAVLLGELRGDAVPRVADARGFHRRRIFRHVGDVQVGDRRLHHANRSIVAVFHEPPDRFRHASDDDVLPESFQHRLMQIERLRALMAFPDFGNERAIAHGIEELIESHRMQRHRFDVADRHAGPLPVDGNAQQTAGRRHVQLGHILLEVLQCRQCAIRCLNLVKHQQRPAGNDGTPRDLRQPTHHGLRIQIHCECLPCA